MIRSIVVLFVALTCLSGQAATLVLPAFAEHLNGANNSLWESELRIYNPTAARGTVAARAVFPYGAATCTGFSPVLVQPGALVQVRSIGCVGGGAAALELDADEGLDVTAITTNVAASSKQDTFCCLSGFTEQIPLVPAAVAYRSAQTIAQLQVPALASFDPLGRHNLGIVNPNDSPLVVRLAFYDADGHPSLLSLRFAESPVAVPPHSLFQLNDVLPQYVGPFESPAFRGYFRVEIAGDQRFYAYDSYVDNTTNDATFLTPTLP